MNSDVIYRTCIICQTNGRIRPDYDPNNKYNDVPVIRCYKKTYSSCCDRFIYVHDLVQCNPNIKLDCEKKLVNLLDDAHNKGFCFVCHKRFKWHLYQKIIVGILFLSGILMIGNASNPNSSLAHQLILGFGWVFGFIFIILLLIMVFTWYRYRKSDLIDI